MASTGINYEALTPDNGAIRSLKELIFAAVTKAPEISSMFNVVPSQQHGKKVGIIGDFGLVGKKSQGCDPTYGNSILKAKEKTWSIKEWEIAESLCYDDLKGTLAQVAMRKKTDVADLTGTEYVDDILMPKLERAAILAVLRLGWFGDENATSVEDGGIIANAAEVEYFNATNGIWKHIFELVAEAPERRVAIAANAKTSKAEQKSAIKESGVATTLLDDLITEAPMELRQAENQRIYITQSLKDALDADIKKNNKGSELQWEALFNGITKTVYNGVEVFAIPFWDAIIRNHEGTSNGAYNKPHRAIYTAKDNLLLGFEGDNEVVDIQAFFVQKDQKNYILAKDTLGSLIADDNLIQVAF